MATADLETRQAALSLVVKSASRTGRRFTGLASTPDFDRRNETVDPLGVAFTNPLPLLMQHDQKAVVGTVILGTPTKDGVPFAATIPEVDEPGAVKDATDRAAHMVRYGLVRSVSVGLRPIAIEPLQNGGLRIKSCEFLEVSLVAVPANAGAAILSVKTAAPSGRISLLPDVSGRARKDAPPMTISEQITAAENKRAAHVARQTDLLTKAANAATTLDETEAEEYDGLAGEVKSIDEHLVRLRALEKANVAAAIAIAPATSHAVAGQPRGGVSVSIRPNVPPGTAFTRIIMAKAYGHGDSFRALEWARQWHDSTPEVELYLKAAVAPGTSTDAAWAGPLAPFQNLQSEFYELLRPRTILGNLTGLRRVPFNVRVPLQTLGGVYGWVGEGAPKPVTKLGFGSVSLGISKIAGIVAITEELARSSSPSAEETVRRDMIAGIAAFMDQQFIDPLIAPVANVHPGSITNGAGTATATGNGWSDIQVMIGKFINNHVPLTKASLIMSETNAFTLGLTLNGLGQPLYPGLNASGGSMMGIPVVTSSAANQLVILVNADDILYADDGAVSIDVSREASIQMDSAPANPADATTVFTSFWQNNLIGLRAERFCHWVRARVVSVEYVTGAMYVAPTPSMADGRGPETPSGPEAKRGIGR